MKIIIDNAGQTCNKFWCYIQPLIHCINTKQKVIIPYHDAQIDYFPNLLKNDYFIYPFYNKFLNRLLGIERYTWWIRKCIKHKHHDFYPFLFKHFGNVFDYAWDSRRESIPQEYFPEIRRIFRPSECIVQEVESLFRNMRKGADIIIGVHIRRGDYRLFMDGKYYYSFAQYTSLCKNIVSFFKGEKIVFFIASNDKIDAEVMSGIDYFTIQNTSVVKDLYGLSVCDYIIGPPSSFSRWASFYGEVPIYFIMGMENLKDSISFKTIASYNTYANGEIIDFDF